jgi:FkbM family methyltransferase
MIDSPVSAEEDVPFVSYAQNFEDVVLWRTFADRKDGTYVDVGAADPVLDSVTKVFYDRGWRGVNIEPASHYADQLDLQRPRDTNVRVCAGAADGEVIFHLAEGTGLSSMSDQAASELVALGYSMRDVAVPVKRLDRIMSEAELQPADIQFLKIDVEGAELSVLNGIDFSVWRPWVVVVEATRPNSIEKTHDQWEHVLLAAGYNHVLFDGLNRYYVATEHPEISDRIGSAPACVFDQPFITAGHASVIELYQSVLSSYERLEALYSEALLSYERLEAIYSGVLQKLSKSNSENDELAGRLTRSTDEVAALGDKIANLERINEDLTIQLDRTGHRLAATEEETGHLRHELRRQALDAVERIQSAEAREAVIAQELSAVLQTVSWRLTSPLRSIQRRRLRR